MDCSQLGTRHSPLYSRLDNSRVQMLLDGANNYKSIQDDLINGSLNHLDANEKKLVLAFFEKKGLLEQAIKNKDKQVIEILIENGYDLKMPTFDFNIKDPDFFLYLIQKGIYRDDTNAPYISGIKRALYNFDSMWEAIIPDLLSLMPIEECRFASRDMLNNLIGIAIRDSATADKLRELMLRVIKERPMDAALIGTTLVGHHSPSKYFEHLVSFVKQGILPHNVAEKIITNCDVVFWQHDSKSAWNELGKILMPSKDLKSILDAADDFQMAVYIYSFLITENLKQAALLSGWINKYADIILSIPNDLKDRLCSHIKSLESVEGKIFGEILPDTCDEKKLILWEKLGYDLNSVNPKTGQNLLFTSIANNLNYSNSLLSTKINFNHKNNKGDNALEHNCRRITDRSVGCINGLVKAGLILNNSFPNIELCRKVFPDNMFLQSILSLILLNPRKEVYRELMQKIKNIDVDAFNAGIDAHPDVKARFCKPERKNKKTKNDGDWRSYYDADAQAFLEIRIKENHVKEGKYLVLGKLWNGKIITAKDLKLIPESHRASLALGAMKAQINEDIKLNKFHWEFTNILKHNDVIHLFRYLFKNPEEMKILKNAYMRLNRMDIRARGGSKSTYASFVHIFMSQLNESEDIDFTSHNVPEKRRDEFKKIYNAYKKTIVHPTVIETIKIDPNCTSWILGRTIVVKNGDHCDAYKFLKDNENYDTFSREMEVTNLFLSMNKEFKSKFHKPVGVYALKTLPEAFLSYESKLPKAPHIVYHYEASPRIFEYLNETPKELYPEARFMCLHDITVLIRKGVSPDSASLFHNTEQNRRYVGLIDLAVMVCRNNDSFNPAGGAGRLDQPLLKIKYSNMRGNGITDLIDARIFNIERPLEGITAEIKEYSSNPKAAYFDRMYNLSCALIVDMLILYDRLEQEGIVDWKNEKFLEKFGEDLAEGYAILCSSYTKQPIEEWRHFVLNSGMEWTAMARQIAFWFDTSDKGYPQYVVAGKLPDGIYPPDAEVIVDDQASNFSPVEGYRTNGERDILAYNGPLGLTYFEKALHDLFTVIMQAEPIQQKKPKQQLDSDFGSIFGIHRWF